MLRTKIDLAFDCAFYYVSDLDRAVRFYSEVLGLTLRSRDFVARFDVDGVLFELVPTSDKSKVHGGGNARVCFVTSNIAAAIAGLKEEGVPTTQPKAEEGGLLASFTDPDGNELCLWQYASK